MTARLQRSFGRDHRAVTVLVLACVLPLVAWGGWTRWAAAAADRVSAAWTLSCRGTTVGSYQGDPAIRSRPGWRCDVALDIVNRSERTVRVTGVEAPLLGSSGGAEIRGFSTVDAKIRDANAPKDGPPARFGDVDAVYDLDLAVPAQSSRTVHLAIGWRGDGCNSAGHLYSDNWPTLVFETLRRTSRYSPEQRLVLRTYDDPHDQKACPQ